MKYGWVGRVLLFAGVLLVGACATPQQSSNGLIREEIPAGSRCVPQYPPSALQQGLQGTTVTGFLIGADGSVKQSEVMQSSGYPILDQAAIQALSTCEFRPASDPDGKPKEAWTTIRYVWTIH